MGVANVKYKKGREVEVLEKTITVGNLHRGNQTITTWINGIKSWERLDNPNRKGLYDTYLDISIDGHVRSAREKRVRAVTTTPIDWKGLENDAVIENLKSPWFIDMMKDIMSYKFEGVTVIELSLKDGFFYDSEVIPRQHVRPEDKIVTFEMYGDRGISYADQPENDYVLEIGKPKDMGLYANIAPYVLMKRDNLAFWSTFNELFGMPFRVYKYNPNDPGARAKVVQQAQTQGAAAYVVLPEGSSVEYKQAQGSSGSSGGAFNALHDTLNKEIDITILGQTLTTDSNGKGSYALGNVHKAVEEAVNLEDRLWMEYVINYQFKEKAMRHGYPLKDVKASFMEVERLPMDEKAKIWLDMVKSGVPIAEKDFYNEFGIPFPDNRPTVVPPTNTNIEDPKESEDPKGKKKSKDTSELSHRLTQLYAGFKSPPLERLDDSRAGGRITLDAASDFEKAWNKIIKRMHEGKQGKVDQELFNLISSQLSKALDEGFSKKLDELVPGTPDYELYLKLRENVYVFSGFKTYKELREASKLLIDSSGKVVPFAQFKEEVLKLHKQYDINYLLTEYNMAVANSQMAEKWLEFEEQKDALPYLRFRSLKDEVARHKKYDGITRKVDDPIWDYLTPLLDWGCRCTLIQVAEAEETPASKLPEESLIKPEFRFNPGRQKVVFPKNHPYYEVAKEDRKASKNLWDLEMPGDEE